MAGPVGMVVGAMTGTLAGAIRDFWIAGVDLDFVDEAERMLLPGKVALVAEVDEEWAVPVEPRSKRAAAPCFVVRAPKSSTRSSTTPSEASRARSSSSGRKPLIRPGRPSPNCRCKIANAKAGLARAVQHAKRRVEALRQ